MFEFPLLHTVRDSPLRLPIASPTTIMVVRVGYFLLLSVQGLSALPEDAFVRPGEVIATWLRGCFRDTPAEVPPALVLQCLRWAKEDAHGALRACHEM